MAIAAPAVDAKKRGGNYGGNPTKTKYQAQKSKNTYTQGKTKNQLHPNPKGKGGNGKGPQHVKPAAPRPNNVVIKPAAKPGGAGIRLRRFVSNTAGTLKRIGQAAVRSVKAAVKIDGDVKMVLARTKVLRRQGSLAEAAAEITRIAKGTKLSARERVALALERRAVIEDSLALIGERAEALDLEGSQDAIDALAEMRKGGRLGLISRFRGFLAKRSARVDAVEAAKRSLASGGLDEALANLEVADGLGGGRRTRDTARQLVKSATKMAMRYAKDGQHDAALSLLEVGGAASGIRGKPGSDERLLNDGLAIGEVIAKQGGVEHALAVFGFAQAAGYRAGLTRAKVDQKVGGAMVNAAAQLAKKGKQTMAARIASLLDQRPQSGAPLATKLTKGDAKRYAKMKQLVGDARLRAAKAKLAEEVAKAQAAGEPDDAEADEEAATDETGGDETGTPIAAAG
jgi:hypothetical protein